MGKLKEMQRQIDGLDIFEDKSLLSDGYHTFAELYEFRKMYNALLFNEWSSQGLYNVHKSKKHNNGDLCFGGGWFVVFAKLPTGQVTNHYKLDDWNLFNIPERERVSELYDEHTSRDVLDRLKNVIDFTGKDYTDIQNILKEGGWKLDKFKTDKEKLTYSLVHKDTLEGHLLVLPRFNFKTSESFVYEDLSKSVLLFRGVISTGEQLSTLITMLGLQDKFF